MRQLILAICMGVQAGGIGAVLYALVALICIPRAGHPRFDARMAWHERTFTGVRAALFGAAVGLTGAVLAWRFM